MSKLKFKKLLITGGAGFIGSNFIKYMLKTYPKVEIVNVDKLSYAGNLNNLSGIENLSNYSFYKEDICNYDAILEILNQHEIEAIIHFAAESHVDRSIEAPDLFITNNIIGTHNLLKAALKSWQERYSLDPTLCRFHHISTDEVYGDLTLDDASFTESSAYKPSSPYSASKAASDHLVRAYWKTFSLPITISNCSNNYGLNQHQEKLIPTVIQRCLTKEKIPVYGNGMNVRDWLHVQDHCEAISLILNNANAGETYNVGGDEETNNLEIVKLICQLFDELLPKEQSYENLINFVKDRLGHDFRYSINSSHIFDKLGWQPKIKLKDGLRALIEESIKTYQKEQQKVIS